MAYKASEIRLDPEARGTLRGWLRASTTEQRYIKRALIVLLTAAGMGSRAIAGEVGVLPGFVGNWRKRFAACGIEGPQNKPRPRREPGYMKATDKRIPRCARFDGSESRARWDCKLVAKTLGDVDVN